MKIKIKSKKIKGKFIHCDFQKGKDAKDLVVLLSGLSGSRDLPLFSVASLFFLEKGFSTLRLNFCNDPDDKRKIVSAPDIGDTNFSFYSAELKNVLDFFQKEHTNIVLVGHSFGAAASIIFLNKYKSYISRTKLILWDPSLLPFDKKAMDSAFVFDSIQKLYIEKDTKRPCLFHKKFYKELSEDVHTVEILRSLNKEVCIVGAAKDSADKDAKKYFSKLKNKQTSKLSLIKSANHMFDGKKAQKELFQETIDFLKQVPQVHK